MAIESSRTVIVGVSHVNKSNTPPSWGTVAAKWNYRGSNLTDFILYLIPERQHTLLIISCLMSDIINYLYLTIDWSRSTKPKNQKKYRNHDFGLNICSPICMQPCKWSLSSRFFIYFISSLFHSIQAKWLPYTTHVRIKSMPLKLRLHCETLKSWEWDIVQ